MTPSRAKQIIKLGGRAALYIRHMTGSEIDHINSFITTTNHLSQFDILRKISRGAKLPGNTRG